MADLGTGVRVNPPVLSHPVTSELVPYNGVLFDSRVINVGPLQTTDYTCLAGTVGQGIVAATGGTPVTVTTKGSSGVFDAQKVTAIIGQQIAAAVSAH